MFGGVLCLCCLITSHNSQSYKIYILELERYQCVDIEMYADSKLSITKHHTEQS